jgi:uridine phosphorylase
MHLALTADQIEGATVAIVPGDPARVERVGQHLDGAVQLAANREFTSMLGRLDGRPVVICSTGIGGPSTSIAVEELAQLGIRTFLRVGTTGSIQPDLPPGRLVVTQASVRLDGASRHFAPMEYPAASDFLCTRTLVDSAEALGYEYRVGLTASSDTFYPGQERYDTVAGDVATAFRGSMVEWRRLHVLNYEMESATLFTMCAANGWRAGCVAGVIAQRTESEMIVDESVVAETEDRAVRTVVEGARRMAALPAGT